jgi:hypothetical protein
MTYGSISYKTMVFLLRRHSVECKITTSGLQELSFAFSLIALTNGPMALGVWDLSYKQIIHMLTH